jgi:hypothetical protein
MTIYSSNSPYAKTPDNGLYLDVMTFRNIAIKADDVSWTVTSAYMHRPDLLSFDLYGDVSYWWVFAVRNKDIIKDPVYDLVPGRVIFLPTLDTIRDSIG